MSLLTTLGSAGLRAQLPLTPGSVVVTGWQGPNHPSVSIFNGTTDPALVLGRNSYVSIATGQNGYSWDRPTFGSDVFGLAIDKRRSIYVAPTTVYGDPILGIHAFDVWPLPVTSVTIWRINGGGAAVPIGLPVALCTLPNSGQGLGNLAYDRARDRLYASNFEDGLIYQIALPGGTVGPTYDHGVEGLPHESRPPVADNPNTGFTSLARRVGARRAR